MNLKRAIGSLTLTTLTYDRDLKREGITKAIHKPQQLFSFQDV